MELFNTHSPLLGPTPPGWAAHALEDFGAFLVDHASCERKAVAQAMALISKCSHEPSITEPMVAIAREELEHFLLVYRLLQRRGLTLGKDEQDPYVQQLLKAMRYPPEERLLDRLLVSCLIEARSAERFLLVAEHLSNIAGIEAGDGARGGQSAVKTDWSELRDFYYDLARTEAGHFRVFLKVATRLYPEAEVQAALSNLSRHEYQVMQAQPWRHGVH